MLSSQVSELLSPQTPLTSFKESGEEKGAWVSGFSSTVGGVWAFVPGQDSVCAKSNVLVEAEWEVGRRAMRANVSGKDQERLRGRVSGAAAVREAKQGSWSQQPLSRLEHGAGGFAQIISKTCVCVCSVTSDSETPRTVPTRLLCPWNSPGKTTRVRCLFLLQGIFPTQGSNPGLPHRRRILYPPGHQGTPIISKAHNKAVRWLPSSPGYRWEDGSPERPWNQASSHQAHKSQLHLVSFGMIGESQWREQETCL